MDIKLLEPKSRDYGASLGGSIARYYINIFISNCLAETDLSGKIVMEIGDDRYASTIKNCKPLVIRNTETSGNKYHFADLETGVGCEKNIADAAIITNVISCLYDYKAALNNIKNMVKDKGTVLITVPGIAQLDKEDYNTCGQYWRFTPMCLERIIKDIFPDSLFNVEIYGNVKSAMNFLNGDTYKSLTTEELLYKDDDYPVLIGAKIII